jgi:hypothetical protein
MGFFKSNPEKDAKEAEHLREGITNERLKFMTNEQIIMVALARFMNALGVADDPLITELFKRGR